jgi:hypothetical protein
MWRMQDGDRSLTESEWALFSTGVALLWGDIEDDICNKTDEVQVGVAVFDRLTPEQKLLLLADVACALRDPEVPDPDHTAANEGAIAAVFSMLRIALETELGFEGSTISSEYSLAIRPKLRAVAEEAEEWEEPLPEATSTDADEWDLLVEEFEGRIFWDADYEMGDELLDLPPEVARATMDLLTIDEQYFLTVPDEPGQRGLYTARQKLRQLLGLPARPDSTSGPVQ